MTLHHDMTWHDIVFWCVHLDICAVLLAVYGERVILKLVLCGNNCRRKCMCMSMAFIVVCLNGLLQRDWRDSLVRLAPCIVRVHCDEL